MHACLIVIDPSQRPRLWLKHREMQLHWQLPLLKLLLRLHFAEPNHPSPKSAVAFQTCSYLDVATSEPDHRPLPTSTNQ